MVTILQKDASGGALISLRVNRIVVREPTTLPSKGLTLSPNPTALLTLSPGN